MLNLETFEIPEECKYLIELCKETVSKKVFKMGSFCKGYQSVREIFLCETKVGKKYFLKSNQGKRLPIRNRFILKDQLAFLISSRLKLNVVPLTLVVGSHYPAAMWDLDDSERKKKINSLLGLKIYDPTTIQLAVEPLDVFQPHFLNTDPDLKDNKLKESLEKWMRNSSSTHNLTNALLFNIITGRFDAEPRNSVLKAGNEKEKTHLYEVDNEDIGYRTTNTWLIWLLKDMQLPRYPLETLAEMKSDSLDSVFQDLKKFGTITFWNEETMKDEQDDYEKNIRCNFQDLQLSLQNVLKEDKGNIPTRKLIQVFNKIHQKI